MFIAKDVPDNIPELKLSETKKLIKIMVEEKMVSSNGEGRRMIKQGAVRVDDAKIDDIHFNIKPGSKNILKVGKRKFLKII